MEPSNLIHTLVHYLSALYNRESDQILQEKLGIGLAQFKILSNLIDNPVAQQKHIAILLGQTEASVSRQIKLLQQKELLTSQVNPKNRREHRTVLTAKGKRLSTNAQKIIDRYQMTALSHVVTKDQARLLELLSKIAPV